MKAKTVTAVFFTLQGIEGYLSAEGWIIADQLLSRMLNTSYSMQVFNDRPQTGYREYGSLSALALWAKSQLEAPLEITRYEIETFDLPDGAIQ